MSNTTKIPCGGFRIGDGLAMDGDTLKSLGGAFVKVGVSRGVVSLWDDSPLKDYWEIKRATENGVVSLIAHIGSHYFSYFCYDTSGGAIIFQFLGVQDDRLAVDEISVSSDNEWSYKGSGYQLTPTT